MCEHAITEFLRGCADANLADHTAALHLLSKHHRVTENVVLKFAARAQSVTRAQLPYPPAADRLPMMPAKTSPTWMPTRSEIGMDFPFLLSFLAVSSACDTPCNVIFHSDARPNHMTKLPCYLKLNGHIHNFIDVILS